MIQINKNLLFSNYLDKFKLVSNIRSIFILQTNYAAKGTKAPTEAELQLQKHASEMRIKQKTSLKGEPYKFQDFSTSIEYMDSEAYKLTYGKDPVWTKYIRNYGGHIKPKWTRLQCIIYGKYRTGNPCPICRDEYLVVHYKNIKLLNQFISETSGLLLPAHLTNVCQKQHFNLQVAYNKAINYGLIEHEIPFRKYDYSLYYDEYKHKVTTPSILLNIISAAKKKNTNNLLIDITDDDVLSINK